MTKEQLEKQLEKVREQQAALEEREKDLAQQLQMAEDEAKMKFIQKKKISMSKLILLTRLSEEDMLRLLKHREQGVGVDAVPSAGGAAAALDDGGAAVALDDGDGGAGADAEAALEDGGAGAEVLGMTEEAFFNEEE